MSCASWDRTGQTVTATYVGVSITGRVIASRVTYGGEVKHTVVAMESADAKIRQIAIGEELVVWEQNITKFMVDSST